MANVFDIFTVKEPNDNESGGSNRSPEAVTVKDDNENTKIQSASTGCKESNTFENKHGGNAPGNNGEEEQRAYKMESSPSFVIPKLKRKEEDLLTDIGIESHEFLQEIRPNIVKSFRSHSSQNRFSFCRVRTVHNAELSQAYIEKRKELKQAGYSDREITDSYGFFLVDSEHEVERLCREGVKIGNQNFSCLGDPSMGVQVSRHADVLRPGALPVRFKSNILIFKIIKGRVKAVYENRNPPYLEPTPNHECHVTKASPIDINAGTNLQIFDSSQVYLYEYGDLTVENRPRHVTPFAVISFTYMDDLRPPLKTMDLSPISPKLPSPGYSPGGRPPASPSYHGYSPGGRAVTTPTRDRVEDEEEFTTWTGQLSVKGLFTCRVEMVSTAACIKPVKLGSILNVTKRCSLQTAKDKYFGQLSNLRKSGEVYWRGNYINVCELRPKADSRSHFQKVMNYLGKHNSMAVLNPDSDTVLLLMPRSNLTFELGLSRRHQYPTVLHCIFLSKQSCKFKAPRYMMHQSHRLQQATNVCPDITCAARSAMSTPSHPFSPLHVSINNNNPPPHPHPPSPSIFTPPPTIPHPDPWSNPPNHQPLSTISTQQPSPHLPNIPNQPSNQIQASRIYASFNHNLPHTPPAHQFTPPQPLHETSPRPAKSLDVRNTSSGQQMHHSSSQPPPGTETGIVPASPTGVAPALSPISRSIVSARGESGTAARLGPVSDDKLLYPYPHQGNVSDRPALHRTASTPELHDPPRPMRVTNLPLGFDEGFHHNAPRHCLLSQGHIQEVFNSQNTLQADMHKAKTSKLKRTPSECEQDSTITSTCAEDESSLDARIRELQNMPPGETVGVPPKKLRSESPEMELSEGEVEAIVKNYVAEPRKQPQEKSPPGAAKTDSDETKVKTFVHSADDMRSFLEDNLQRSNVPNKTGKTAPDSQKEKNSTTPTEVAKSLEEQENVSSTDGKETLEDGKHLSTVNDMKDFLNSTLSKPPKRPPSQVKKDRPRGFNPKEKKTTDKEESQKKVVKDKHRQRRYQSTIITVVPMCRDSSKSLSASIASRLGVSPSSSSTSAAATNSSPAPPAPSLSANSSSKPDERDATTSTPPSNLTPSTDPPCPQPPSRRKTSPVIPTSPGFLSLSRQNVDITNQLVPALLLTPPRCVKAQSDITQVKIINTYHGQTSIPSHDKIDVIRYMLHGLHTSTAPSPLSESVMIVLHMEDEEEDIRFVKTADEKVDEESTGEESVVSIDSDNLAESTHSRRRSSDGKPVKNNSSSMSSSSSGLEPSLKHNSDVTTKKGRLDSEGTSSANEKETGSSWKAVTGSKGVESDKMKATDMTERKHSPCLESSIDKEINLVEMDTCTKTNDDEADRDVTEQTDKTKPHLDNVQTQDSMKTSSEPSTSSPPSTQVPEQETESSQQSLESNKHLGSSQHDTNRDEKKIKESDNTRHDLKCHSKQSQSSMAKSSPLQSPPVIPSMAAAGLMCDSFEPGLKSDKVLPSSDISNKKQENIPIETEPMEIQRIQVITGAVEREPGNENVHDEYTMQQPFTDHWHVLDTYISKSVDLQPQLKIARIDDLQKDSKQSTEQPSRWDQSNSNLENTSKHSRSESQDKSIGKSDSDKLRKSDHSKTSGKEKSLTSRSSSSDKSSSDKRSKTEHHSSSKLEKSKSDKRDKTEKEKKSSHQRSKSENRPKSDRTSDLISESMSSRDGDRQRSTSGDVSKGKNEKKRSKSSDSGQRESRPREKSERPKTDDIKSKSKSRDDLSSSNSSRSRDKAKHDSHRDRSKEKSKSEKRQRCSPEKKDDKKSSGHSSRESSRSRHSSASSSKTNVSKSSESVDKQLKDVSKIADALSKPKDVKSGSKKDRDKNIKKTDPKHGFIKKQKSSWVEIEPEPKPNKPISSEKNDLEEMSKIADRISNQSKETSKPDMKSKAREAFMKKHSKNLASKFEHIPGLYSDEMSAELLKIDPLSITSESCPPSFDFKNKSAGTTDRSKLPDEASKAVGGSIEKALSETKLVEDPEKDVDTEMSEDDAPARGVSSVVTVPVSNKALPHNKTPERNDEDKNVRSEKTDSSSNEKDSQRKEAEKDKEQQDAVIGQPVRNLTSNQISEDRHSRQFHPYRKTRRQKPMASFNIGIKNLDDLLVNMTASTLKEKRLAEYWHFGSNHNFRQRSRFANYNFVRNPVPQSPEKSRPEEEFTADNIPEFETRREQADLLDDFFMEGGSQHTEQTSTFEMEKRSYGNEIEDKENAVQLDAHKEYKGPDVRRVVTFGSPQSKASTSQSSSRKTEGFFDQLGWSFGPNKIQTRDSVSSSSRDFAVDQSISNDAFPEDAKYDTFTEEGNEQPDVEPLEDAVELNEDDVRECVLDLPEAPEEHGLSDTENSRRVELTVGDKFEDLPKPTDQERQSELEETTYRDTIINLPKPLEGSKVRLHKDPRLQRQRSIIPEVSETVSDTDSYKPPTVNIPFIGESISSYSKEDLMRDQTNEKDQDNVHLETGDNLQDLPMSIDDDDDDDDDKEPVEEDTSHQPNFDYLSDFVPERPSRSRSLSETDKPEQTSPSKSFSVFKSMWSSKTGVSLSVPSTSDKEKEAETTKTSVETNRHEDVKRKTEAAKMLEELNRYVVSPENSNSLPETPPNPIPSNSSKDIVIDTKLTSFIGCLEPSILESVAERSNDAVSDTGLAERLKVINRQLSQEDSKDSTVSANMSDVYPQPPAAENTGATKPAKGKKRKHSRRPTGPHPDRFNRWEHVVFPFTCDPWRDFKYERNPNLGDYHLLELHDSPSSDPRRNKAILQKRDREIAVKQEKEKSEREQQAQKESALNKPPVRNQMIEGDLFAPTLAEQITCGAEARRRRLGLTNLLTSAAKTYDTLQKNDGDCPKQTEARKDDSSSMKKPSRSDHSSHEKKSYKDYVAEKSGNKIESSTRAPSNIAVSSKISASDMRSSNDYVTLHQVSSKPKTEKKISREIPIEQSKPAEKTNSDAEKDINRRKTHKKQVQSDEKESSQMSSHCTREKEMPLKRQNSDPLSGKRASPVVIDLTESPDKVRKRHPSSQMKRKHSVSLSEGSNKSQKTDKSDTTSSTNDPVSRKNSPAIQLDDREIPDDESTVDYAKLSDNLSREGSPAISISDKPYFRQLSDMNTNNSHTTLDDGSFNTVKECSTDGMNNSSAKKNSKELEENIEERQTMLDKFDTDMVDLEKVIDTYKNMNETILEPIDMVLDTDEEYQSTPCLDEKYIEEEEIEDSVQCTNPSTVQAPPGFTDTFRPTENTHFENSNTVRNTPSGRLSDTSLSKSAKKAKMIIKNSLGITENNGKFTLNLKRPASATAAPVKSNIDDRLWKYCTSVDPVIKGIMSQVEARESEDSAEEDPLGLTAHEKAKGDLETPAERLSEHDLRNSQSEKKTLNPSSKSKRSQPLLKTPDSFRSNRSQPLLKTPDNYKDSFRSNRSQPLLKTPENNADSFRSKHSQPLLKTQENNADSFRSKHSQPLLKTPENNADSFRSNQSQLLLKTPDDNADSFKSYQSQPLLKTQENNAHSFRPIPTQNQQIQRDPGFLGYYLNRQEGNPSDQPVQSDTGANPRGRVYINPRMMHLFPHVQQPVSQNLNQEQPSNSIYLNPHFVSNSNSLNPQNLVGQNLQYTSPVGSLPYPVSSLANTVGLPWNLNTSFGLNLSTTFSQPEMHVPSPLSYQTSRTPSPNVMTLMTSRTPSPGLIMTTMNSRTPTPPGLLVSSIDSRPPLSIGVPASVEHMALLQQQRMTQMMEDRVSRVARTFSPVAFDGSPCLSGSNHGSFSNDSNFSPLVSQEITDKMDLPLEFKNRTETDVSRSELEKTEDLDSLHASRDISTPGSSQSSSRNQPLDIDHVLESFVTHYLPHKKDSIHTHSSSPDPDVQEFQERINQQIGSTLSQLHNTSDSKENYNRGLPPHHNISGVFQSLSDKVSVPYGLHQELDQSEKSVLKQLDQVQSSVYVSNVSPRRVSRQRLAQGGLVSVDDDFFFKDNPDHLEKILSSMYTQSRAGRMWQLFIHATVIIELSKFKKEQGKQYGDIQKKLGLVSWYRKRGIVRIVPECDCDRYMRSLYSLGLCIEKLQQQSNITSSFILSEHGDISNISKTNQRVVYLRPQTFIDTYLT